MPKKATRRTGADLSYPQFWILMSLLTGRPNYGWGITHEVEEMTEGKVKLGAATLYDNLKRLIDDGYVEHAGEKEIASNETRKHYKITGLGAKAVEDYLDLMDKAMDKARSARSLTNPLLAVNEGKLVW